MESWVIQYASCTGTAGDGTSDNLIDSEKMLTWCWPYGEDRGDWFTGLARCVSSTSAVVNQEPVILPDGGEMDNAICSLDWSRTSIGARESWSPALNTMVRILLANRFPMLLWWGPEYVSIYNDAYIPILGQKHPWALGRPVRECWWEIWDILKPLIDTPFHCGPATWSEDIELHINRAGFMEETHFTIAYSPVPDETAQRGVGGVLATVHEITAKIVGQRRGTALREIASAVEAKTAEEACANVAAMLARHAKDIPFALIYLSDPDGNAKLAAATGIGNAPAAAPASISLRDQSAIWPLHRAQATGSMQLAGLSRGFPATPPGPWPEPPDTAAVLPIRSHLSHQFSGFLIAGLSSRLRLDDSYTDFLNLVTSQVATAISTAVAYEEERRRAEALAEIDRVKTAFFSNVSHEFRTPLTLMLGPLEELLDQPLAPDLRDKIDLAHRNSLRLLKLVNSLLDFSRIEASRMKAHYVPVDLAAVTRDLASNFRSALQAASLEFIVNCAPLPEPVYVDVEMWEKIVLNLLSNAFKFTMAGRIVVTLEAIASDVVLSVSDTGVGIPEAELPRIFERFYRVEGTNGRSYEGTGIGLALMQELVRMHGGSVTVESEEGRGSTFSVRIPRGARHLPSERVTTAAIEARSSARPEAWVSEALRWLPAGGSVPAGGGIDVRTERPPCVLLADDNADMREYVARLLGDSMRVTAVSNGQEALASALANPPDLVLSDVMMPALNGFELLRELRSHSRTRAIPVILLSARAGEDSRIEGVSAGADDYLTKPFSAGELRARVESHLKLARERKQAEAQLRKSEERFRALVTASSDAVYQMNADWSGMRHLVGREFIVDTLKPGKFWLDTYISPEDQPIVSATIEEAVRSRSVFALEHRVIRADGTVGWIFSRAVPVLNDAGEIVEWFGAASDITDLKNAEEALRQSEERFRQLAEVGPQIVWMSSPCGELEFVNRRWVEFSGLDLEATQNSELIERYLHPDDNVLARWRESLAAGKPFELEARLRGRGGEFRWFMMRSVPVRDASGRIQRWIGTSTDIHQNKLMQLELRRANQDLEQFAYSASHDLQEPLRSVKIFSELLFERFQDGLDPQAVEFLSTVREGASRMEMLVRDLLAYTQATTIDMPAERVDANKAFEAALANLAGAVVESGATVDHGPMPFVPIHPTQLQQLFQNLIGNAIKYHRPGVPPVVHTTARSENGTWIFSVKDNGIGVEPEFRDKIFGLFKRLHTRAEYSGTGIGLALCQRIVERHHGRIWVESEPGEGSTFHFTLPN